jgi:hypothetical protein
MSRRFVTVQHYSSLYEAEVAKSVLDANGILSVIQRGGSVAVGAFIQNTESDELLVGEDDYARAKELLKI